MNIYEKLDIWDIYLAEVKFQDRDIWKNRPVLIIEDKITLVISLKMTSHSPREGEYAIKYWKRANLNKPTTVRINKILTLDKSQLIHKIGRLQAEDIEEIKLLIDDLF